MKKLTSKQKLFILPWIIFTALFSLPLIIFPDIDEILSNEMVGGVIIFGYSPMYLLSTTMTIAKLRWNKRQTILFTKKELVMAGILMLLGYAIIAGAAYYNTLICTGKFCMFIGLIVICPYTFLTLNFTDSELLTLVFQLISMSLIMFFTPYLTFSIMKKKFEK